MDKPFNVYLAGKVNGLKWKFVDSINKEKAVFRSSDGYSKEHSDAAGHLIQKYLTWSVNTYDEKDFIIEGCLNEIRDSDFVVSYINQEVSYGTIAEIAYASSLGKQVYLFIDGEDREEIDQLDDAYWFVSNFPRVIVIKNTESKPFLCSHVLTTICNIESEIELKFYNKILFEGMVDKHTVECQVKLNKYRVDFLIDDKIVIEVDGHDYHSSKEQKATDNKRDRKLTSLGYKVFRYTGSEIWHDMDDIIKELKTFLEERKDAA